VAEVKAAGVDLELFHNKQVQYSGIQLSTYQGRAEWTAIGQPSVAALQLWFDLFGQRHPEWMEHTVAIQESYTPRFLPTPRGYQIKPLLLSDELSRTLSTLDQAAAVKERLARYLYGNLQRFFGHIAYAFDKEQHYLRVRVTKALPYDRRLPIYHGQKKQAFRVYFTCNFDLPQTLRLGQSTALGYGNVSVFERREKVL